MSPHDRTNKRENGYLKSAKGAYPGRKRRPIAWPGLAWTDFVTHARHLRLKRFERSAAVERLERIEPIHRFANACGYTKEELDEVESLSETWAFSDWRELLIYERSWLELYASQGFCLEGTASERMARTVDGLTKHYGIERNSEGIRYWTLHMGVDEEHMKVGPLAVERYAVTDIEQKQVRHIVKKTLDKFWLAFDGIRRAFVDRDPMYAWWRNGR